MLYSSTTVAFIAALSLAVIPVVRSAEHQVIIGGPGLLTFQPASLEAAVGDTVLFLFKQKNHTVTQSSLASPCTPLQGGFDSGFVPVADTLTSNFPTARFQVKSTDPVWAFCAQGTHCQSGMNFAINPGEKLTQFQAAATGSVASSPSSAAPASVSAITVTATVTVGGGGVQTTTYTTAASSASNSAVVVASSSTASASSPAATASGTVHKVIVGGTGKLLFDPSTLTASIGDTIIYEFHQTNHSVVQSSFTSPCTPLAGGGFNSGFFPVSDQATVFPTFSVVVNNTAPIWAYCSQTSHCGKGMVFSANAVETGENNSTAFLNNAKSTVSTVNNEASRSSSSWIILMAMGLLGAFVAI